MAAIGHGLVGLALSGCVPREARNHRLPYLWPGLVVLLAYAVDLTEWGATILAPELIDRRPVTHSPILVACLAVGACVVLGVYCRWRRPWPYVVIAGAVLSHVLLDLPSVRLALAQWYSGRTFTDEHPASTAPVLAELWAYGAPLVWVLLIRAGLARRVSGGVRAVSCGLLVLALAATLSRNGVVWGTVYAASVLHAIIVLRRHLNLRLLWNVLPMLPIVALGITAWLATHRFEQGKSLAKQGLDRQAVHAYQAALDVPSRIGRNGIYMRMGMSYEKLGDLSAADRYYRRAVALSPRPGWPVVVLAGFYVRHQGTSFHHPDQAVRLIEELLRARGVPEAIQASARNALERWRRRGVVP